MESVESDVGNFELAFSALSAERLRSYALYQMAMFPMTLGDP